MKKILILLSVCLIALVSCKKEEIIPDALNGTTWRYLEDMNGPLGDFFYQETLTFNTPNVHLSTTYVGTKPIPGEFPDGYMDGVYNCTSNMGSILMPEVVIGDKDGNLQVVEIFREFEYNEDRLIIPTLTNQGRNLVYERVR